MNKYPDFVKLWESVPYSGDPALRNRIWQMITKSISHRRHLRRLRNASFFGFAAAAMFALGLFLPQLFQGSLIKPQDSKIVWQTAQNGGQMLPDGSLVWLEAGSRVSFSKTMAHDRQVDLQGSATFDVVHLVDNAPLYVNLPTATIKVTGTRFSVRNNEASNTNVTLFEGAVEFYTANSSEGIKLKPMQELNHNATTGEIEVNNIFSGINWQSGEYLLKNADLKELASFLKWKYGVNISIRNIKDNTQKFNGTIGYNESVDSVIDKVCYVLKLKHHKDTNTFYLYK